MKGGMVEHGGPALPVMEAKFYGWGPSHKEAMRASPMRKRLWAFTMQGEDLPGSRPTGSISTRPSATCGAFRWPVTPTGPTGTSWPPLPTTARGWRPSSMRWVRSGPRW